MSSTSSRAESLAALALVRQRVPRSGGACPHRAPPRTRSGKLALGQRSLHPRDHEAGRRQHGPDPLTLEPPGSTAAADPRISRGPRNHVSKVTVGTLRTAPLGMRARNALRAAVSPNQCVGPPITKRSAPAKLSAVASLAATITVSSMPRFWAMARATHSVLPNRESNTTTAFTSLPDPLR